MTNNQMAVDSTGEPLISLGILVASKWQTWLAEQPCLSKTRIRGHYIELTSSNTKYARIILYVMSFWIFWIGHWNGNKIDHLTWRSCYYSPRLISYTIRYSILYYQYLYTKKNDEYEWQYSCRQKCERKWERAQDWNGLGILVVSKFGSPHRNKMTEKRQKWTLRFYNFGTELADARATSSKSQRFERDGGCSRLIRDGGVV